MADDSGYVVATLLSAGAVRLWFCSSQARAQPPVRASAIYWTAEALSKVGASYFAFESSYVGLPNLPSPSRTEFRESRSTANERS